MAINLVNHIRAEMTASMHTTLFRFSFPSDDVIPPYNTTYHDVGASVNSPIIQIDLKDLGETMATPFVGCQVYPETGRMIGEGVFSPSFGRGQYKAYFCADFQGGAIRRVGTFQGDNATTSELWINGLPRVWENPSASSGPWIQFEKTPEILARVGISFMSPDQACESAEAEIPTFDFEGTVAKAEDVWREKMSPIQVDVTGVDPELLTVFWSGLYRSMLSPQNYTGENPLWNSTEPYYDSFYCIWDSFRAQHPLLTLVDPDGQTEMIRALLDIYRNAGKLPDCRMSFSKGYSQVRSSRTL
jgi:putative alpha-1,2-mannosidase